MQVTEIILIFAANLIFYLMGRRKSFEKEPVTIRFKELANGNKSIYLDIYRDGKRYYEFLKLYLVPEVGRTKKEARKKNSETMATVNIIKAERVLEIKNGISGITTHKGKMLLVDWIEKYKELKMKTSRAPGNTANHLECTKRQLLRYKGDSIRLKDIDKKFCQGFLEHLNTTKTSTGKPLSNNTKVLYYRYFDEILRKAVKEGIISHDPFAEIDKNEKPKIPESRRVYLDLDEVKRLAVTDCPSQAVKRAFMFSCFCGLRISDIRRLKWSDITDGRNEDGKVFHHLSIVQKKTNRMVSYNLSEEAMKWLPEKCGTDTIFSGLKPNTISNNIKKWVEAAGINKPITFHCARHTFGTMMLTLGADLYTTSKLMGHTKIATTEIYAKIVDKKKDEAMGLIDKFFDK